MSQKVPWSGSEDAFLLAHYTEYGTYAEIAAAINAACGGSRTAEAVKVRLRQKYRCGIGRSTGKPYTAQEQEYILAHKSDMTLREIAEGLRRLTGREATPSAIGHYMTDVLGTSRFGRAGVICKGERIGKVCEIGAEALNAAGYVLVKVADTGKKSDWKTKQQVVWEKRNGKAAPGIVVFLNGNRKDFSEDNLYCVNRKTHAVMCRNKWYTDSREHTLAAIKWCELFYALKGAGKDERA